MQKQQYRKKDGASVTDAAYQKAPTRDGGDRPRGRGGRGNTRGRGGNDRDQDQRPRQEGTQRGRGRGGRGRGGETGGQSMQGAGGNRRPIDVNSWQWKYRNEERPTFEKITVAVDTKLPTLPALDDVLKKPSKDVFDRSMREQDRLVEEKRIVIDEARYNRKQVYEGGKVEGQNVTYRDLINQQGSEIQKVRGERRGHLDRLNGLKERQRALEGQKQDILRNIPRNYHNEKDMVHAIKDKQRKYETSSMSNQDEKKLLRDIDLLKKALPDMAKLSAIDPELATIREEKKGISAKLDVVKRVLDDREDKIQDVKASAQAQRDKQSEVRDRADKFTEIVDKNNEDVQNAFKTKDRLREEYYKNLYEFELQNDKVRWIRGLMRSQKDISAASEDKRQRIANKKAEIENRENPKQKEIETCDDLIKYCNKLRAQKGLVPEASEVVAKKTEQSMIAEYNRQDIEQKLKDGKIQAMYKKDDGIVKVGGGKGKKGKKQRQPKNENTEGFKIDFAVINKFGVIGVSPPLGADDLESKIQEINDKLKSYKKSGNEQMDQEKNALEQDIEKMVEQDIEAEKKAAEEEEYGEEEEKIDAPVKTQKRKEPKGEWGEFDGSDDDDENDNSAYSKPSRGGGQKVNQGRQGQRGNRGGKSSFMNDEDNFPTL